MSTTWTIVSAAAFAVAAFNIGVFLHAWAGARCDRRRVRALLDKLRAEGYCFRDVKWWRLSLWLHAEFSMMSHIDVPSLDRYVFEWMQEEQGL